MNRGHTVDFDIKSRVTVHDGGTLGIQLFKELTNKDNGTHIDLAYSNFIMDDVAPFSVSVGSKWYSSGLSRYNFGFYDKEVRAGRPSHNPGVALVPYVGLSSFYKLRSGIGLYGNIFS